MLRSCSMRSSVHDIQISSSFHAAGHIVRIAILSDRCRDGPACGKIGEAIGENAMNDQPQISNPDPANIRTGPAFAEPGVPHIHTLNVPGMQALYVKEVRRFFKVQRTEEHKSEIKSIMRNT